MASVVIDALKCEVSYDITAGGTLGGELVGPSYFYRNFNEECPEQMMATSVTPTCEESCLTCQSTNCCASFLPATVLVNLPDY